MKFKVKGIEEFTEKENKVIMQHVETLSFVVLYLPAEQGLEEYQLGTEFELIPVKAFSDYQLKEHLYGSENAQG